MNERTDERTDKRTDTLRIIFLRQPVWLGEAKNVGGGRCQHLAPPTYCLYSQTVVAIYGSGL